MCVSGRLTSLSFLLIFILTEKSARRKAEEGILGQGRRAGRPPDVSQEATRCAIKEREIAKGVFEGVFALSAEVNGRSETSASK